MLTNSYGTTITWVKASGTGSWNSSANWSPAQVPGPSDTVIFNSSVSSNCMLSSDVTVASLQASSSYSGSFMSTGYNLTVTENADFTNFSNGILFNPDDTIKIIGSSANLTIKDNDWVANVLLSGNITLQGSHLYEGTFIIDGNVSTNNNFTLNSSIIIETGGSIGSISGNIVNNDSIIFNNTNDLTFSGLLTGAGKVIKQGSGKLIFSASQSYSGLTTINDGTLQLGNGSSTGSLTGNIVNNSILSFHNNGTASNMPGIISGNGTVNLNGSTLIRFNGNNTATGTVNVASTATMNICAGGTPGAIPGSIVNLSGNMNWNCQADKTFSGVINGTGSFTKGYNNQLTLTGANTCTGTFTITNGTLNLGNNGTTGIWVGNIIGGGGAGPKLKFNRSDDISYAGVISGSNAAFVVEKAGAGKLTVTNNSTFLGSFNILSGNVELNGSLHASSNTTVSSGAILSGSTTQIGALTVQSGATLALDNSMQTTLQAGNFVLGPTTTLNIDIGASSDQIIASGNVQLDGTWNLIEGASLSAGSFVLLSYTGTVADNGITIGTQPVGYDCKIIIDTDLKQVRLGVGYNPVITSNGGGATGSQNIQENTTNATTVIATVDPGLSGDYTISGGADASLFNIYLTTGELVFINPPDYENPTDANSNNVYEVQVTVTDDFGRTDVQDLSFTVSNVANESFTWDASATAGIQGGNGTWGTDAFWTINGGTTRQAWNGTDQSATFAGSDGTYAITVANKPYFTNIQFDNSGYTLDGDTIIPNANATISVAAGKTNTIYSRIKGPYTKTGTGTLKVYEFNYWGTVTVQQGTFAIYGGTSNGFRNDINVSDGATLRLDTNHAIGNTQTVDLTGANSTWDMNGKSDATGWLTGAGQVLLNNGTLTLDLAGATVKTFSGIVSGAGNLNLRGNNCTSSQGTLKLSGSNTYTGSTFITEGVLGNSRWMALQLIGGNNRLPATTDLIFGTDGRTGLSGRIILGDGTGAVNQTITGLGSSAKSTGNYSIIGGNATKSILDINNTSDYTFYGSIGKHAASSDSMISVIKRGTGTQTLADSNFYSGTTSIQAGTLNVTLYLSPLSAVTVSSGATLAGNGNVAGSVTVNNGGIVAPGNAGAGTLKTGALTLNSTSIVNFELGSTSDKIDVTGNATLDGTWNITNIVGYTAGTYTLLTYTGTAIDNGITLGTQPSGYDYNLIHDVALKTVKLVVGHSPIITSNGGGATASISMNENLTTVTTVTASDVELNTVSYSITGGADQAKFSINSSSGELTFNTAPNYESPNDANLNGVYEVIVSASDGSGMPDDSQTLSITVTNANDIAPVIGASQSFNIAENSANTTVVGTITATDADGSIATPNWSIVSGNTNAVFALNSSTGVLTVANNSTLNYESTTSYTLSITVSDGVNTSAAQNVTINITNINDNTPIVTAAQSFTLAENSSNGTTVATLAATDADGAITTFSNWTIVSGNTGSAFAIDPSTGVLTVATGSALNYESITSYSLVVKVSDGTYTSANQNVTVNITNINDNTPMITAGQTFSIAENSANTSTVGTVLATDGDAGVTTFQNWSITGGNGSGIFAINATTGQLTIANNSSLNYESATSHTLTITVSDGTNSSAAQNVTIQVTDVNDIKPIIATGLIFSVSESATNGTSVGTATATDADITPTTLQNWTITAGNIGSVFAINSSSGAITVGNNTNLNYESLASYTLTLTVSDGINTSNSQTVTINITNQNDNHPVITSNQVFAIDENSPNNTIIGTIVATDGDGATTFSSWTITDGNTGSVFALNASTGILTVATTALLNHESTASFNLSVTVSDGLNTSSIKNVTINVNDIPEAPVIANNGSASTATMSIPENQSFVVSISAKDQDENSTITYSLSGADSHLFEIVKTSDTTGTLQFKLPPDFETDISASSLNQYVVTTTASDGALSDSQTWTITVTDVTTLAITSDGGGATASLSIAENTTLVTTVIASAESGAMTYSIEPAAASTTDINHFQINSTTGILEFIAGQDYENPADQDGDRIYHVDVKVFDGASSVIQTLSITITETNDITPMITSGQIRTVAENEDNGFLIGSPILATDADLSPTTFQNWTILSGNTNGVFALNSTTGQITIADHNFLNYENTPTYTLSITVSDGVHTSAPIDVVIDVTDWNDINPVVTSGLSFDLPENTTNTTFVGKVTASDADATTTVFQNWAITSGNSDNIFSIHSSNGDITINDNSKLDYETYTSYTLTVQVSDGTNTSASEMVIINITDINDILPVITNSQSFTIAENTTTGSIFGIVQATDGDATATTFSNWTILSGNEEGKFALNTNTGELSLISNLNYETDSIYSLNLTVSDGVNTSLSKIVTIKINNINDEAPVIPADQEFTIAENISMGTVIGSVTATDLDIGAIFSNWSIISGNSSGKFSINTSTGELTVIGALDFEQTTTYSLGITVSDGTNTSTPQIVSIHLTNINDINPIVTAGQIFSVSESATIGTNVGTILATDDDAGATTYQNWSIVGGNIGGAFLLDANGGLVTVASALDYETTPSYTLIITVSDGLNTSAIQNVIVNIINGNDNVPEISMGQNFTLAENVSIGSSVGLVQANDHDGNASLTNWIITSGNELGDFALNATTGELTIANALDFETKTSYNLTITVSDGFNTSTPQSVAIYITNMNDEVPIVDSPLHFVIEENTPNLSPVGTITATDGEAGLTTFQNWTIISGNNSNAFSINANTGLISVDNEIMIDYETNPIFNLGITVSDGVNTSTPQSVEIEISNLNDELPALLDTTISISENTNIGTSIIDLNATDADGNLITYSIISGNTNNAFSISPTTGQVTLSKKVDYETQNQYLLSIGLSDGLYHETMLLTVNILDVFENLYATPFQQGNLIFRKFDLSNQTFSRDTVALSDTISINATDWISWKIPMKLGVGDSLEWDTISFPNQLKWTSNVRGDTLAIQGSFTTAGIYPIKLLWTNLDGSSDTLIHYLSIKSKVNPSLNITWNSAKAISNTGIMKALIVQESMDSLSYPTGASYLLLNVTTSDKSLTFKSLSSGVTIVKCYDRYLITIDLNSKLYAINRNIQFLLDNQAFNLFITQEGNLVSTRLINKNRYRTSMLLKNYDLLGRLQ